MTTTNNLLPTVPCEACGMAGADLVRTCDGDLVALCNDCVVALSDPADLTREYLAALVDVHRTLIAYEAARDRIATMPRPWAGHTFPEDDDISEPPAALYVHDTVRVEISDAVDDCIVITVGALDTADRMVLEVSRGEAREIVAGIAAVL